MKKRIFSRILALFMALSLLTTTVFAASLDDLQEAINGTKDQTEATDTVDASPVPQPDPDTLEPPAEPPVTDSQEEAEPPAEPERTPDSDKTHVNGALVRTDEDGTNYFGYGWSSVTEGENKTWYYAIEAHDEQGNRYVVLLDDVSKGNGEASGVVIGQDGSSQNVTIDMKGHNITGNGEGAVITVKENAELNLNNGTISGGEIGIDVLGTLILDSVTVTNSGIGVKINDSGKVTFNGDKNKADVELKVGEKTYKVDADTAEALMKEPVATGTDWMLVEGKNGDYIVAYTGAGDKTNQLTQMAVRNVLNTAVGNDSKIISGFAVPDGVKSIGAGAFNGQKDLKTISIPDSVETISYSFQNCSSLERFTIPKSVTSCHTLAFSGCTNLKEIRILGGIDIGANMFYNFTSLESVEISDKVASIAYGAFQCCTNLKTVKWPEKAAFTEIGDRAFINCSSLEGTISIPDGVKTIGMQAFMGCGSVENIVLPNTVTAINGSAFQGCESLENINIPDSVTTIAASAFHTCSSLETVVIPSGVTAIGNSTFANCTSLKSITIPTSVSSIGNAAFTSCKSLTSIELPNGLTSIGEKAFANCTNLESITIPTSVTKIGYRVFGFDKNKFPGTDYQNLICGVKSIWIYPDNTNNGDKTIDALAAQQNSVKDINVFVVNEDAVLYRDGKVVNFNGVGGNDKVVSGKNDEGLVIVSIPALDLTITHNDTTTTVDLFDGATVIVNEDGSLIIPSRCSINGQDYYNAAIAPDGTITGNEIQNDNATISNFTFDFDTTGTGDDTIIEDEEIPLAGLISRAQLVSYLYAREGSPDGEDAGDEYALAWAWGVENEIVDEEDDPEEIVTVAILREVMTNYAEFLGTTFDVVIKEADDMPVMNCDEILAEFFASLEGKAA